MLETLAERVNSDSALVHRGRWLSTRFLVRIGKESWLVEIVEGKVHRIMKGPFVMPSWVFALSASETAWAKFWQARPEPGFHDLFALIKQRTLVVEGDLHPFMANLFYFKSVFAKLRSVA